MLAVMKAAMVAGQAALEGLQHTEQDNILSFLNGLIAPFKDATLTILSYMKTTALVAGVSVPAIAVAYNVTGSGSGLASGSAVFVVPGPEVGTGMSFVVVAAILALGALFRSKRSATN